MVAWNEKNTEVFKTAVVKLAGLDKWETDKGEMVAIHGEQGEKFTAFMNVWSKQGIRLEDLHYGDELKVQYREKTIPDGRTFCNFVSVYKAGEEMPF